MQYEQLFVRVRDLRTDRTRRFDTLLDCADYFQIHPKRLWQHLQSRLAGRLTKRWHVFQLELIEGDCIFPALEGNEHQENSWDGRYGRWVAYQDKTDAILIAETHAELLAGLEAMPERLQRLSEREYLYRDWFILFTDSPSQELIRLVKDGADIPY